MSPVTHFLTGWVFANTTDFGRRDRAIVTLSCVVPDVDGIGIVPELLTRSSAHPLLWFSLYHHRLHTLTFALVIATTAFFLADKKWKTALLSFASFHLHLVEDIAGSRGPDGYQWPIPYFAPFSHAADLVWRGQWALNAWPNVLITIVLLLLTLLLAWKRGYSPLEMISRRADAEFTSTLRRRFAHARI
jgi:hypothetical protein